MQTRYRRSCGVLVLAALAFASPALAQPQPAGQHHDHATHATPATTKTPAQRWATDAPLRDGMRRIRQAVTVLDHYEHGHMDATQAINTAKLIDTAVADMMAKCKLKPDADVALHGLLAQFLAGAKAVRESKQAPVADIAKMRQALARYPQLFVDPSWAKPH